MKLLYSLVIIVFGFLAEATPTSRSNKRQRTGKEHHGLPGKVVKPGQKWPLSDLPNEVSSEILSRLDKPSLKNLNQVPHFAT